MTGVVTGTFEGITKGIVEFRTNTADGVLRDPSGNVLWAGPKKVRLVSGELSVVLPATDDTAYAETDWQWCASIKLDGRTSSFLRWFELPDGETVDLADIAGELAPGDPLSHPAAQADLDALFADVTAAFDAALEGADMVTHDELADLADPEDVAAFLVDEAVQDSLADYIGRVADGEFLGHNRVPDPQLKNSGISGVAGTKTTITSGLPTGFVSGVQVVRTGAQATIGQIFAGTTTSGAYTSTYAIPVTAGEQITASGYAWTDKSSARARLDLHFYDAAGAAVGSLSAGTYTNIVASTWERRVQVATVPANAAFCRPSVFLTPVSGTSTDPTARATGFMVRTGNYPVADYGDGDSTGWEWDGVADASASHQTAPLWLPADDTETLQGIVERQAAADRGDAGVTVYRDGNTLLIRHPHDSTTDLVTPLGLAQSTTPGDTRVRMSLSGLWGNVRTIDKDTIDAAIWPIPDPLPGTLIHTPDDDNAPINACTSYIAGNHGWGCGRTITLTAHGKVLADVGSTWTDGSRTFTLLKIIDANNLLIGIPYTTVSGRTIVSSVGPSGTLTHVSGATNTGSISIAGGSLFTQVGPVTPSATRTVDVKIDGQRLNDGITHGQVLEVVETYGVVSYSDLIDWSQANVGSDPFANLASMSLLARISNTWRWAGDRNVIVGQTVTPLEEFNGWFMVTQATGVQLPTSGSVRQFFPGATGTAAGLNLATEANLTSSQSGDLTITLAEQEDADEPVSRTYQWGYSSGGARQYGILIGLLPVMDGKLATRKTNETDDASWFMANSTKKNYPRVTGPEFVFEVGETYSAVAFRRYLSPEDPAEVVVSDGSRSWVLIDSATANATVKTAKVPQVQGRALDDVETVTVVRVKDYVTPEGITYTNPAPGHMMSEAVVDTTV